MSTYSDVLKKALVDAHNDRPSIVLAFDKLSQAYPTLLKIFDQERDALRICKERMVNIEGVNVVGKSLHLLKDDKYYSVVVAFNPNDEQLEQLNTQNIGKLITVKNQ